MKLERGARRSYLASAYIHILGPRARGIAIVLSSACRGNNSAGATTRRCVVYRSSSLGRGENRARDRSRPLYLPPAGGLPFSLSPACSIYLSSLVGSGPGPDDGDQRVFNYPDKISRDRSPTLEEEEVVAIYINSRRDVR